MALTSDQPGGPAGGRGPTLPVRAARSARLHRPLRANLPAGTASLAWLAVVLVPLWCVVP